MKFELNNKVYDVLKWMALIALPALSVLYNVLANVWGWPFANEVSVTINAIIAFIGTLIGISTGAYNKQQGEKTNPGETGCDEKEPVLS